MKTAFFCSCVWVAGIAYAGTVTDPGWETGADIVIAKGDTVILSVATPELNSLSVAGTLVCSNWETRVWSKSVTVADKGKITTVNSYRNGPTNRIWIACETLDVQTGGKIDADGLGFAIRSNTDEKNSGKPGYGPGAPAFNAAYLGASHGGYGSYRYDNGSKGWSSDLLYDDPSSPLLPGSSGAPNDQWSGCTPGGGAVRIEAKGAVTVNGAILANVSALGNRGGSGSGGSIYITCATLAGKGTITADGGRSKCGAMKTWNGAAYEKGSAGGGGCISIVYDTSLQTGETVAGMTISAEAGYFTNSTGTTYDDGESSYRLEADMGTLYFPDGKLLPTLLGKGLSGRLVGVREYTHSGDLNWTAGRVRFAAPGEKTVTVAGSLVITNARSRLEVGGSYAQFTSLYNDIRDDAPVVFCVKGNMTVADGGRFDVRAAATNGTEYAYGARVEVAGALTVCSNASVYVWSDSFAAGAPEIVVGSLNVAFGGLISAKGRGGHGSYNGFNAAAPYNMGWGRGSSGGGHGGVGGYHTPGYVGDQRGAQAYDDEWLPGLAGAGAGGGKIYARGGSGGGAILVSAAGVVTVDGEVNADGDPYQYQTDAAGGGSGGTVLIRCKTLAGAQTGRVTANGGASTISTTYKSGSGAGGRIAVWTGYQNYRTGIKAKYVEKGCARPEGYLGMIDALHGHHPYEDDATKSQADLDEYVGGDGTVRYVDVKAQPGLLLLLK